MKMICQTAMAWRNGLIIPFIRVNFKMVINQGMERLFLQMDQVIKVCGKMIAITALEYSLGKMAQDMMAIGKTGK